VETREEEREQARRLGRHINREARRNPSSPYAGKVVGIRRGEVVIGADTLDEVAQVLECLEPDAQRRYFIDASADYDAHYTIGMHGSTVTGDAHDV